MSRTRELFVYQAMDGDWRWRLYAVNGNIIAESGEGYTKRSGAIKAARAVFNGTPIRLQYHDDRAGLVRRPL